MRGEARTAWKEDELSLKFTAITLLTMAALGIGGGKTYLSRESPPRGPEEAQTFEEKLKAGIPEFDAGRRPMADAVLALAYRYRLPLAVEHVTRDAVQKPLDLHIRRTSVRDIIAALAASVPGYRVELSHGLVDLYFPDARLEPLNPLNLVVGEYRVSGVDTHMADAMLLCGLGRQLDPTSGGCGGSIAGGQWGPLKITLEMRNAKVYEILDAIVAQNGQAVWTPIKLPKVPELWGHSLSNFWYIYPLDPPFEAVAAERLRSLFPPSGQAVRR